MYELVFSNSLSVPGNPLQSSSMGVDIFFSLMRSYFCLFVAAFKPCHGKLPRRKYMKTYPSDSMSSLRLCSAGKGKLRSELHEYHTQKLTKVYNRFVGFINTMHKTQPNTEILRREIRSKIFLSNSFVYFRDFPHDSRLTGLKCPKARCP